MDIPLPLSSESFEQLSWSKIKPWYDELIATTLSSETVPLWLSQWSHLSELVDETLARLEIACTQDTGDQEAVQRKERFLNNIALPVQSYDQQIKEQLLASGLTPEGYVIPLRNLRTEAMLFHEANLPLLNEEETLSSEYLQVNGAQMVPWGDNQVSIASLRPVLLDPERQRREMAWRRMNERQQADRERLHRLWVKGIQLRQKIAHNAGFDTYRDYRWQQLFRFDYTPADCKRFHEAVEEVIVPAASRIWEKRRKQLGVDSLRPWDISVDPQGNTPPRIFSDMDIVLQKCTTAFGFIDPHLQSYFTTMIREGLCDLEERPRKANRGYNMHLEVRRRPFIFGQVKSMWDLVTVFHEAGHAFQVFEMSHLPSIHQRKESFLPLEFAEVASTSMELIAVMYLHRAGFCTPAEETRLRIQHLERFVAQLFPLAVRGDAFQHWVYENPERAMEQGACNQKWEELSLRYVPDIDWSGLDVERGSEWQQVRHFYGWPFYYIEYAFAALGALQVWNNYLRDPHTSLQQYRYALSLGATRTVPELFEAAGVKFAFDATTLNGMLQPMMQTIEKLESEENQRTTHQEKTE
ncbi:M3 family oligoendopeptidase [Ktedonobacter racemifer]|uniref:Peptidase M3A and M3B thimet/oligopeptidase F n=1 Tax=Ktedonobacter racemifer DSM 44963 TaxID=485913 RepID=D6U5K7_KTERA|nr:M3 family oligoendopeptidase [Ktedonobacter racemifer]EFH80268.1 peptidase M3A and M3B thimet/oligopeptidase F [Ktedonobacter racemifer DSM 44963]